MYAHNKNRKTPSHQSNKTTEVIQTVLISFVYDFFSAAVEFLILSISLMLTLAQAHLLLYNYASVKFSINLIFKLFVSSSTCILAGCTRLSHSMVSCLKS